MTDMTNFNRLFVSVLNRGGLVEYSVEHTADKSHPLLKIRYRVLAEQSTEELCDEFCQTIAKSLNCFVIEDLHGDSRNCLYLLPVIEKDSTVEFIAA